LLAAAFPGLGIGFLEVSFAFGLAVLTMAYGVGHISGGHFNSAVTVGLWAGGRFKAADGYAASLSRETDMGRHEIRSLD
jgi:aquaporin Z